MVLRSLQGHLQLPGKHVCFYFLCYRTVTTTGLGLGTWRLSVWSAWKSSGSIEERVSDIGNHSGRAQLARLHKGLQ